MEQEKKGRGGARQGAGRKPYGTTLVSWRVSESAKEWIKAQAKYQGCTTAQIIDELISSFEERVEQEAKELGWQ